MSVFRQAAIADAVPFPFHTQSFEFGMHYCLRELGGKFSVDAETFRALRLPETLQCVLYGRSTVLNPAASVVIPVHNRHHTLARALGSALALRGDAPIEVVLIDDGSDDGTTALLAELNDPRISAVGLQKRHGANMARNVGVAIARAPVIAFLDSDDAYLEGRLSDPLSLLVRNPEVGVVISSFVSRKEGVDRLLALRERTYDGEAFKRLIAQYILPPSTSGLTIRRELLLKCGGFDPTVRRIQDRDLLLRVAPYTRAATSAVVSWRKHWSGDGISSPRDTYYKALCEFLERHPLYAGEELTTRNYLIARHLLALVKRGHVARAAEIYRHARSSLSPCLPPLPRLLLAYLSTRRRRRKMVRSVCSSSACDQRRGGRGATYGHASAPA